MTKTKTAREIIEAHPGAGLDILIPLYLAVYPDSGEMAARTRLHYALMHPTKTDGRAANKRIRRFVVSQKGD